MATEPNLETNLGIAEPGSNQLEELEQDVGAPTAAPEEEGDISIQLGDKILLLGGRLDMTRGVIYYLDETLMRILPDGVSDRLINLPIIDGDIDTRLGKIYLVSKGKTDTFVSLADLRVGNYAETFKENGDEGPIFKIVAVDEEGDNATFEDPAGQTYRFDFQFIGIPRDMGSSFAVIRSREPPSETGQNESPESIQDVEEGDELIVEEYTEPQDEEYFEVEATKRVYPDLIQRNDMMNELLQALPEASRKNPNKLKEIRKLVESFITLRNKVTRYNSSGESNGMIQTSFQTMGDLLKSDVPLSRPVIAGKKVLQLDEIDSSEETYKDYENPTDLTDINLIPRYLRDTVMKSVDYQNTQLGGAQSAYVNRNSLPNWYISWNVYFKKLFPSWISEGEGEIWQFKQSKDFFRAPLPNTVEEHVDALGIVPRYNSMDTIYKVVTVDYIKKVKYGIQRGTSARYTRIRERPTELRIEGADEGLVENVILFPLSVEKHLCSPRSGRIIYDIARSQAPLVTMTDIFDKLGGVQTPATGGGILATGEGGNINGLVTVVDWLTMQPLFLEGMFDALFSLQSFGFTDREFTLEQQEILIRKIENMRALIKQNILVEREKSAKRIEQLKLVNHVFLEGTALQEFIDRITSEPLLLSILQQLREKTPYYSENDMAITAAMLSKTPDLFLAVLSGVAAPLAIERNRVVRQQFLDALRDATMTALKKGMVGEKPIPNRCPHVATLTTIRKVRDDSQRMKLLAKFVTQFNAGKQDNWLECIQCNQHLLCVHEFLQIQEFLRPREKDILQKEILLAFSGGQQSARYICKNCGQSISDLEFDSGMEYDDNGRPMMGRAVMVDKDAQEEEDIEVLLRTGVSKVEVTFATESQNVIYTAAKQIFERVGIDATDESYRRIVLRVDGELLKIPSPEIYMKKQEGEKKGRIDYIVYTSRILVGALAANCLVEVQTHIPGYILRYKMPQCKAGFSGIPIDMNEDETGIQYIGCAVASIMTDSAPWNLTGYQREPEFTKRSDNIAKLVKKFATVIIQDSSVQQQLIMKRAYLMSVYGKETLDTKLHERLPYRFLPAMLEKEETVVTSAATPMNVIRGWMAIADKHAVENSDIVKGSPNMESSCCFIPINQPGSFWLDKGLPDIGRKLQLDGPVGSHIAVHISPRRPPRIKVSIPDAIYYKVFLKLCFTGIRKGLPHEPGYDRVCPHCNFVFPMDPFEALESIPSSSDKRTQKELLKEYDAKSAELVQLGKVALTEQGIDINKDTFDVLLDDAHLQNRVAKVSKIRPKAGLELMQELANIQPEPYTGWRALMAQTITNVESLAEDASETEVAEVYGPLSMKTDEFMRDLQERLSEKQVTTLRMMLQQPVTHMVESVQTYFLVTFQRILCGFKPESLDIPKRGLGTDTIDHLKEMLKFHMNILGKLQNTHIFVKSKLTHARDCLVAVLKIIQKNIRTPYIPGGENGVPYIINSLILGILDEFGNPNITPISVSERASAVSVEARTPLIIIDACLTQFRAEALNFTDTQIQEEIERRGQLEREYFTKNKEKLSPDEARIYMIQQRLGLGKFAVGKGIQKYDVEQAQLDAEQRTAMGINDTEFFEQQEEADGGYDDGAQDFEDNF